MMSQPQPQPLSQPQPRQDDTAKKVGIGCLIAALVMAGLMVALYLLGKSMLRQVVENYTETRPRALPESTLPPDQALEVGLRLDRFREALKAGAAAAPLVLTGDEINALISHHPDAKHLAGKARVAIEGKKVRAEASIPLDKVGGMFRGRFLNGNGAFTVLLTDGRLIIFLDSLELAGKPMPDWLMRELRGKNLAEKANTDKENAAFLARFESVSIEDGRVRIVPKRGP